MRMRLVFAVVICVLIVGCEERFVDRSIQVKGATVKEAIVQETTFDLSKVVTVGNRSWVPLNLPGSPQEHAKEILDFLKYFEDKKEVEVVDWKIDKQQSAQGAGEKTFGLWLDHRPRQK